MKKIIINEDNILDEDITDYKILDNYIFISDNKILLKNHHNSFYFIHSEDLNASYDKELFIIKKEYILDYPFIGDKTLMIKNFYLINGKIDINDTIWIDLNVVTKILQENMFNNPRVQDVTKEIIEVINYLLTNNNLII